MFALRADLTACVHAWVSLHARLPVVMYFIDTTLSLLFFMSVTLLSPTAVRS